MAVIMSVYELGEEEDKLLLKINGMEGTIEEKSNQMTAAGILDRYSRIHNCYAALAEYDSEALKRGLFLQWYSMVEPPFLSGIHVNPLSEKRIIDILDHRISVNEFDAELRSMVSYYSAWKFVFDRFHASRNLMRLLNSPLTHDAVMWQLRHSDFAGRGQMGEYWLSIISLD
ncbi:hypothetical protein [Dyadobacter luticola]|uniref:Uncharacterized protein n=1 Tax=Dyadobacter luticola TaxID=1979387 RepID=A0A5R9L3D5_9BACT|nr:hypothetical protein [Dyadobacter luticola]TLV02869.1 hypothetical protein FEN17_04455 [Dyadobacter luticola]